MKLKITRDMYFILIKEKNKAFNYTYEHTRDEFGKFNGCIYFAKTI